jgi:hypothetical protein
MSESNVRHPVGRPTSRRTRIEDLAATGHPLSDEALRSITGGAGGAVVFKGSTITSSGATYDHDEKACYDDN